MLILIQWNDVGHMNNLVALQANEWSKPICQAMESCKSPTYVIIFTSAENLKHAFSHFDINFTLSHYTDCFSVHDLLTYIGIFFTFVTSSLQCNTWNINLHNKTSAYEFVESVEKDIFSPGIFLVFVCSPPVVSRPIRTELGFSCILVNSPFGNQKTNCIFQKQSPNRQL